MGWGLKGQGLVTGGEAKNPLLSSFPASALCMLG
jgi:hypothetical protein